MQKISFIINSKKLKRCNNIDKINEKISGKFTTEILYTEKPTDGINKAKQATENGADYVIAVGGDGTINEVANGILKSNSEKKPIMGILPCGTGDDFVKTLKIRELTKALENPKIEKIDVLQVKYNNNNKQEIRYSLNITDIGISALTVKFINGSKKRLGSTLTFFAATLRAFLTYKHKKFIVTGDNFKYKTLITIVSVANGKFFGGGMGIAPEAKINDGIIDITLIGNVKITEFIKYFPKLRKCQKINHPNVYYHKTKKITVQHPKNIAFIEGDGELFGSTPTEITILPKKINILT